MTRGTDDWIDIAKGLPQGGSIRTSCSESCGVDKSQIVNHTNKGYSRHCFRCGGSDFKGYGLRSIELIRRHKQDRELVEKTGVKLPKDFTLDIPSRAAVWLYKYGISAELAKSYGIGYSEYFDRVVLPVYTDNELVAVQQRAVHPDHKPKYLNPRGPKVDHALFWSTAVETDYVVVTEDILSAIKVGKVATSVSTLGTVLNAFRASQIASKTHHVVMWYDNDPAGKAGTKKAIQELGLVGVNVSVIYTDDDPKACSLDFIRQQLERITMKL